MSSHHFDPFLSVHSQSESGKKVRKEKMITKENNLQGRDQSAEERNDVTTDGENE